jgi:hypothetical protein
MPHHLWCIFAAGWMKYSLHVTKKEKNQLFSGPQEKEKNQSCPTVFIPAS